MPACALLFRKCKQNNPVMFFRIFAIVITISDITTVIRDSLCNNYLLLNKKLYTKEDYSNDNK